MPFAHTARELGWLSRAPGGVLVSESLAERLTEAAGAAYVAEQTVAVERLEQQPTPEPAGPAVLQGSADGAMISLVGKQWVEVKTLALGTVVQEADGTVRAQELSYFSRRAEHATFRRLALVETYRRGVGTALEVVAVMDGAGWLQKFIDFHRPDAIRILDFPHAVEYLSRASHEAHGTGTATTSEWIGTQAHALKHEGPAPVLAALRALPTGEHRDGALEYLEPRLPQLQYPTFRAAGYPIGSGIVESANKVVVEDRLKGSGMHWAPAHVDPLLALRTIVCADRWDEAWPQIAARLQGADRARRAQRRQRANDRRATREAARRDAASPTLTTTPGSPARKSAPRGTLRTRSPCRRGTRSARSRADRSRSSSRPIAWAPQATSTPSQSPAQPRSARRQRTAGRRSPCRPWPTPDHRQARSHNAHIESPWSSRTGAEHPWPPHRNRPAPRHRDRRCVLGGSLL